MASGGCAARNELINLLEHHEWRVGVVATVLGVHRTTLFRRMRRLQIDVSLGLRRSNEMPGSACDDLASLGRQRHDDGAIARPRLTM